MKRLLFTLTFIVTTAVAAQLSAQSLADLARQEKERRAKVTTDAKVITNNARATDAATTEAETTASKQPDRAVNSADGKPKPDKQADDEPKDLFGRTESFWRQTFSDARKRVKDLEDESRVLQLKVNDLQNKFYAEASGFKQQDIQREIQKSFYEQDQNKQSLAKAKAELQQLEVEARKSGALPGWIDGRTP